MKKEGDVTICRFLGIGLLIWWAFDFLLKVHIYGFFGFDFLWFCSSASLLLAYGILRRNVDFVAGFLGIALVGQTPWIADFVWMSLTGDSFNGLSTYAFQPGFGHIEYVNTTRHLFMIPIGLFAWMVFWKESAKYAKVIILFLVPLLTASYLLTHPEDNSNCVFAPCVSAVDVGLGQPYFFFFFLTVMVLISCVFAFGINSLVRYVVGKRIALKKVKRTAAWVLVGFLCLGMAISVRGFFLHANAPTINVEGFYHCDGCAADFTYKYVYSNFKEYNESYVVFLAKNMGAKFVYCNLTVVEDFLESGRSVNVSTAVFYGMPSEERWIGVKIEYPSEDIGLRLESLCGAYETA